MRWEEADEEEKKVKEHPGARIKNSKEKGTRGPKQVWGTSEGKGENLKRVSVFVVCVWKLCVRVYALLQ